MDTRLEARGHILATEIIFSHKREIFGGGGESLGILSLLLQTWASFPMLKVRASGKISINYNSN